MIERVLRDAMRREGWLNGTADLVDRPADKGGLTRGGVTARTYGDYLGLKRPADRGELLAMTEAQALDFYHEWFVQRTGLEAIGDPALRALIVDWAFTSDRWAVRKLQDVLTSRGLYHGDSDGIFGSMTAAALKNDTDPRGTYRAVLAARVRFYRNAAFDADVQSFLLRNPRSQLHNLGGWLNRCLDFLP